MATVIRGGKRFDSRSGRFEPNSTLLIDEGVIAAIDQPLAGDHRLACQVIEFAVAAEPESHAVHEARATIYAARRSVETSLMAKGIFTGDSTCVGPIRARLRSDETSGGEITQMADGELFPADSVLP